MCCGTTNRQQPASEHYEATHPSACSPPVRCPLALARMPMPEPRQPLRAGWTRHPPHNAPWRLPQIRSPAHHHPHAGLALLSPVSAPCRSPNPQQSLGAHAPAGPRGPFPQACLQPPEPGPASHQRLQKAPQQASCVPQPWLVQQLYFAPFQALSWQRAGGLSYLAGRMVAWRGRFPVPSVPPRLGARLTSSWDERP